LNELENSFSRIKNYHITNKEVGNKVIFLRKLAAGGSTHSFGIHVARMAGMPPELIKRANEMLAMLEASRDNAAAHSNNPTEVIKEMQQPKMQLSIFDVHSVTFEEIRKILNETDVNQLTPVEALLKLQEIKSKLH
jgi:DNA mismatch repair protein MutS